MEQKPRTRRNRLYFIILTFGFAILLSVYFIYSNRYKPKTSRALYLLVDRAFKGIITVRHSCKGGEKLDFFNTVTKYELRHNAVNFKNDLTDCQIGILNKDDLYDTNGTMKYLVDKNPRVISIERSKAGAGDCSGLVKIIVDIAQ